MRNEHLNKLLLAAVILLAVGEGILFSRGSGQPSALSGIQANGAQSSSSSPAVELPPTPMPILVPIAGTVASISGNTLTLSVGSSTRKIAVGSDTAIVRVGILKDPATFEADIQKFHQESNRLMQDPQKNQRALQRLIAPSRNVETQISLSQVIPGARVIVFADGQNTDGTYTVYRIQVTNVR